MQEKLEKQKQEQKMEKLKLNNKNQLCVWVKHPFYLRWLMQCLACKKFNTKANMGELFKEWSLFEKYLNSPLFILRFNGK